MGSTYKANSDEHEVARPKRAYVHRRHFESDNNIRIQGQQSTVIDSVGYPRVDPYDYIERFRESHNIYIYIRGHVYTRGPIDGTAAAAVSTNL